MKSPPVFSVVILAWQVEPYICECMESVRNQTFSDFEAIIIAPPGKDRTQTLCREFARNDARFRVVETENRGQLMNRVVGFSVARGDYLLCVDGDDLWKADLLQTVYDGFCESQCDMLVFGHERFSGGQVFKTVLGVFPNQAVFDGVRKNDVYEKYIRSGPINEIWGKAFRREVFQQIAADWGKYESIRKSEDLLFCCYLTNQADSVMYLDRVLYRYRRNENGVTLIFRENEIKDYYFVRSEIRRFMTKWWMEDKRYLDLFYQSLAHYTVDWVFRCATSALRSAKKKELYEWLRNEAPFYEELKPYMDKGVGLGRHRIFWFLFNMNDDLLNRYAAAYRFMKRCKNRFHPSIAREIGLL